MNLARLVFVAVLLAFAPWAQALVFAVNEGVTYRVSNDEIRARYAAIATDLSKLLGQPVRVEPVGDYKELRKGLAAKTYDLALVHPAHLSIVALKDGYKLVAVTKGYTEYKASFLVRGDAPYKTLADLRGKKMGLPDEDSITAWMVRATVRETMGDAKAMNYSYTRYQDAVPFMVENTFTQVGGTAANALVKDWLAKNGKVLGTSKPVPIKHLIAGPSISAEQLPQLRAYFTSLDDSEAGRKKLEPIKVQGYQAYDEAALLKLGVWLGL
jgi:ABC-type phosphate/phosphonate transport system substrate-binding protein